MADAPGDAQELAVLQACCIGTDSADTDKHKVRMEEESEKLRHAAEKESCARMSTRPIIWGNVRLWHTPAFPTQPVTFTGSRTTYRDPSSRLQATFEQVRARAKEAAQWDKK